MKDDAIETSRRTIGLDCHPDSFTAALIEGQIPAQSVVRKVFNKVPISRLKGWASKHTTAEDTIVLEASGNSFQVVRELQSIDRKAVVLESVQIGQLKKVHANNDKISAVRIGKAYLAGTAREVWVPDSQTQERRDWFHAHNKAVKRTTQMTNRIKSYLSDNGVRLKANKPLSSQCSAILGSNNWSPRQQQVLNGMFMELHHAQEQRDHWRSLIAQEVLADPQLLSMVRLCGVRDKVAFALGAIIGDIKRFQSAKKLVAYVGLHPAFDDSGENTWRGGIAGHGRKDLRSLLIESAQSILRSKNHHMAKWGKKLLATKGSYKLAVAAIARKLTVAIWYLMNGRWTQFEELDPKMSAKLGKIITNVGIEGLRTMGTSRTELRHMATQRLREGKDYILDYGKRFMPKPSQPTAQGSP